jgi:malate dehydrogenase (oxaloacetate-decarboxylating)
VTDLVGVDRGGIVTARRSTARDPIFRRLGKRSNPRDLDGTVEQALDGADVFVGVSAGNTIDEEQLRLMGRNAIVFAMANPVPEIEPAIARRHATVVATGRSDHPNQINNVLCFPGLFRGLLDAGATRVSTAMKLAAADAIASLIANDQLSAENIIPSPFDERVVPTVAEAVAAVVHREGAVASH